MNDKESGAGVRSSCDIDTVVITLFIVAWHWHREDDEQLKTKVYVILQKPNKQYGQYSITRLLEEIYSINQSEKIGLTVAVTLCIRWNDFTTGFRNKRHRMIFLTI